ncbi:MAG: hypothetical protein GWP91_19615 [Rhodobacterales bacterium]|nr:hypothetical protein [Rhodobacterales bacterium]
MHRRIPAQALRGSDKLMLEVPIPDMLRRPMGQLAPANVCDLVALAECDDCPRALKEGLDKFVERTAKEVTDIPPGTLFEGFLDELAEIEAGRVPSTYRTWMATQADERQNERLGNLVQAWAEVEPEVFTFGQRTVKVEHRTAAAASPATSLSRPTTGKGRAKAATPKVAGAKKASTAAKRANKPPADPARVKLILTLVMDRLDESSAKGLSEIVLIAGIRHRAKDHDCNGVSLAEVTSVLRDLKKQERVHYSAGRWTSLRRW